MSSNQSVVHSITQMSNKYYNKVCHRIGNAFIPSTGDSFNYNSKDANHKSIEYYEKIDYLLNELSGQVLSNTPHTIDLKSRKAMALSMDSNSTQSVSEESFVAKLRSYKINISDKNDINIDNTFFGSFVCSVLDKTQKTAPNSVLLGGLIGAVIGGGLGAVSGLFVENVLKVLILLRDSWLRANGVTLD